MSGRQNDGQNDCGFFKRINGEVVPIIIEKCHFPLAPRLAAREAEAFVSAQGAFWLFLSLAYETLYL